MKKPAPPIDEKQKVRSKAKKKTWKFGSKWKPGKVFCKWKFENGRWVKTSIPAEHQEDYSCLWSFKKNPFIPNSKYPTLGSAMQSWESIKDDFWRDFEHASVWLENTETGEKVVLV